MPDSGSSQLLLGCQSWTSPDWDSTFYPATLAPADRLHHYADPAFAPGHVIDVDSTTAMW